MNKYLWLAGGVAMIIVTYFYGESRYEAGVTAEQARLYESYKARESENAANYERTIDKRTKERDDALTLVDTLRSRPPVTVTKEVTKIVKESECQRVTDDMLQLLNSTGNSVPRK